MNYYFMADVLRCCVTDVMAILLLFTLAQPKYGKKITVITVLCVLVADVVSSVYFYLQNDYTTLAKFDLLILLLICIVAKPLFRDNIMQWLFNFLTMINVYVAIMFISYHLCDFFPHPYYANSVLRFLMFAAVIFLLRRYLRPLYRLAVEHWKVFFLVVAGITANFGYMILFSGDIEATLIDKAVPTLLDILLAAFVYIAIFQALKTVASEHELRGENARSRMQQEHLTKELSLYNDSLELAKQNRHDLRHHNAIILEYLTDGDIDGAKSYLKQYDTKLGEAELRQYCKNPVANTIFRLYSRRSRTAGISFVINADIPEGLLISASDLGVLFSNVLENAYEACEQSQNVERHIVIVADNDGEQLCIDIRNTVDKEILFQDAFPVSGKEGGGTGTKSVAAMVSRYKGMLRFKQENGEFLVQIILPMH